MRLGKAGRGVSETLARVSPRPSPTNHRPSLSSDFPASQQIDNSSAPRQDHFNVLFGKPLDLFSLHAQTPPSITMDERARIPVSLPHANPTISYWQDPPDALADHRTTPDLPAAADTVIIGSGITGAAVAWNLLQGQNPGSIVMLEARQACSGATGRNGNTSLFTFPSPSPSLNTPLHSARRTPPGPPPRSTRSTQPQTHAQNSTLLEYRHIN